MRLLTGMSLFGLAAAVGLHLAALFGRVWGGEWPLAMLFLLMFATFGPAVLRVALLGLEEGSSRPDLGRFVPRWLAVSCGSAALYGFYAGFTPGKFYHQVGEVLTPEKAAKLYAVTIPFFAGAVLLHVSLSRKRSQT